MSFESRSQLFGAQFESKGESVRALAWVGVRRSVANVYLARIGQGSAETTRLTEYVDDDGMIITLHGFDPEHPNVLHFSRSASEDANPLHLASGPPIPVLFAVDLSEPTPQAKVLLEGKQISLMTTGRIIWTERFQFWAPAGGDDVVSKFTGSVVKELSVTEGLSLKGQGEEVLFEVRHGTVEGLVASPDGSAIAFSNVRGDHALIGIFRFGSPSLQWLSASYEYDSQPAWLHGSLLAWKRQHDTTGFDGRDVRCVKYGYCNRGGPAFSIMVQDTENSSPVAARVLYQDMRTGYPDENAGYGNRQIFYIPKTKEIAFGCEASGYIHLCAAKIDGSGEPRDLTDLPCDHQNWEMYHDEIFVTHGCDNIDSLGISVISTSTWERKTIVVGEDHIVSGMSPTGPALHAFPSGGVAFFSCTVNQSNAVMYMDYPEMYRVSEDGLSESSFVPPKLVQFPSADGKFTIHAQLYLGAATRSSEQKLPGIIFTHGGCQRQMYAAFHYDEDYASLYTVNQFLANSVGPVLSINYRGGPGYGVQFRAANGSGWQGASEYADILAGHDFLSSLPNVDAEKIGVYGLSYGGLNAMQAVSRNSDLFAAAVANAPVVNWASTLRYGSSYNLGGKPFDNQPERWHGLYRALKFGPRPDIAGPAWQLHTEANLKLAWESSPSSRLHNISSPLLLIQGDADESVAFQETLGCWRALAQIGTLKEKLDFLVIPGERHGFALFRNKVTAAIRTAEHFEKWL
eukprot:g3768.t1